MVLPPENPRRFDTEQFRILRPTLGGLHGKRNGLVSDCASRHGSPRPDGGGFRGRTRGRQPRPKTWPRPVTSMALRTGGDGSARVSWTPAAAAELRALTRAPRP